MSTVVDNDKYIINGSTLSAIGDALREAGASTRIVTETKYYKTDSTGTGKTERTIQASFFTGLSSTPTQAFIQVTKVDDSTNCEGITSPIKQKLSVGDQLILPLPFTYKGFVLYGSYYYNIGLNIYPLDAEGNFLIPEDTTGYTAVTTNRKQILPILVEDIPSLISVPIDYQGLSYSYVTIDNRPYFGHATTKSYWTTFIPLTSGQKVGFCVGETVSNELRASFFQGKVYSDFQQYVTQPASKQKLIYRTGDGITGATQLTGDGLLKRFYYTAPSDGELIVMTSSNGTSAPLHVWRA